MRLPILAVLALGITSVTASADQATPARVDREPAAALVCEPPTVDRCADLDYRETTCGLEQREVCSGLLVQLYAGAPE